MAISRSGASKDVVRYWAAPQGAARTELKALLKECYGPGRRADGECASFRLGLDEFVRNKVAADPARFARGHRPWRVTRNSPSFPVFKTDKDPFVIFTMYKDGDGDFVVTVLHFGRLGTSESFDRELWDLVEPRLRLISSGGTSSEEGSSR